MLKKQTVWLLTMLSLVVVLSVYYIMSPESKNAVQMQSEKSASDSGEVATEKAPAKQDTKEKAVQKLKKEKKMEQRERKIHQQTRKHPLKPVKKELLLRKQLMMICLRRTVLI